MALQITFSADQVSWMRDVFNLIALPIGGWIVKSWIKKLKAALNDIITENTNRNRDELEVIFNAKLDDHEKKESARFDKVEDHLKTMRGIVRP